MVGVPGKYKGCETCRLRRVKCDNERPYCKKCADSGRQCAGYERETVFIIGTVEDGGRCSSHPPRVIKPKKAKGSPSKKNPSEDVNLIPTEPFQPAWDDLISVSNGGSFYQVQLAALRTSLDTTERAAEEGDEHRFKIYNLANYTPSNLYPPMVEEEFAIRAQCMVHLNEADESQVRNPRTVATDSICLYLYDHNASLVINSLPPWNDTVSRADPVRHLGPASFKAFPGHHFFARVYRPNAVSVALVNRKSTFLSGPEWITVPWESHPKSWTDRLFDVIVLLPSLLSRSDRITPYTPTMARRLMAQDLLVNCLNVERLFDDWHMAVNPGCVDLTRPLVFWIENPEFMDARIPFAETFAFQNSVAAITFIHFWMSLVLFYPCIEQVHTSIFQPVVDAFPQIYPNLPPNLQIDISKYGVKEVRELAANICRSLDFALNATVQPDLLIAPLYVVEEFYKGINISYGDAALELIWCDGFRHRLTIKGVDISEVVQSRTWVEVAQY